MICGRCGSDRISISPVTQWTEKHRGCFGWACWILLAIVTCGLILIIPAVTNSKVKSKTRNRAVCQHCGKSWWV